MSTPRYRQIAEELTREIRDGRWRVGEFLPTEHELCARYSISRHTAREALRRLREVGLIERRQGSGTRVSSRLPTIAFEQRVGSIEDLLQYGRTTRFDVRAVMRERASAQTAAWFDIEIDVPLIHLQGVRRERGGERPLCTTDVYVLQEGNEQRYGHHAEQALKAMLDDLDVNHLGRVEQEFSAIAMPAPAAREFGLKAGVPALAALRRYFDLRGRLFLIARSVHPGESARLSMALGQDVLNAARTR